MKATNSNALCSATDSWNNYRITDVAYKQNIYQASGMFKYFAVEYHFTS